MAYNALRYASMMPAIEPISNLNHFALLRQGEQDGIEAGQRDLRRQVGGRMAAGDMTGAMQTAYAGGDLAAGSDIHGMIKGLDESKRAHQQQAFAMLGELAKHGQANPATWQRTVAALRQQGYNVGKEFDDPQQGPMLAQTLSGKFAEALTPYQQKQLELAGEDNRLQREQFDWQRNKPVEVGPKSTLVDPQTGKPIYTPQAEGVDPMTQLEAGKFGQSLRKEFSSLSGDYRAISDGYGRVQAGLSRKDGAGDMAIVFGVMKMLDPNSVVREGEFATGANVSGPAQQYANLYNSILKGDKLPDAARQQLAALAGDLYARKSQEQQSVMKQFEDIARRSGVPVEDVIMQLGSGGAAPGQAPAAASDPLGIR